MSSAPILGVIGSAIILIVLFEMMRRHRLREKYALIWFLIAIAGMAGAAFPGLLERTSALLGIAVPTNLLFFVASIVLLILTLQQSYELGKLEERTRTLAEEIAMLRVEAEQHRAETDAEGLRSRNVEDA